MGTFVEVGQALLEIRTGKLYRRENGRDFETFEEYCQNPIAGLRKEQVGALP
jgi:hypothetical protein